MKSPQLLNIKKSQEQYFELLSAYKNDFLGKKLSIRKVAIMLDEIKCFWLERLNIIEYELEELTEDNLCFLLSGAIYLNVSNYEQFYFKSFGDFHLLCDPFLKMEQFFRIPEKQIDGEDIIDYARTVFNDTLQILTSYPNCFYILPVREIAIKNPQRHRKMLDKFFWAFISTAFNSEFEDDEAFCRKYHTFEEIQQGMECFIYKHLLFSDVGDVHLSLRQRIEQYYDTQFSISSLLKGKKDPEVFLISVFSLVSQVIDILLVCVALRVCPYIRFDVTFNYLSIIMYTFIENLELKDTIEKTIIFYLMHKIITKDRFKGMDFEDYCRQIANKSMMDTVLKEVHASKIDIFKGGIKNVESIITKEFEDIL
jgi:hypothetical protein